jgi:hypothetical protein
MGSRGRAVHACCKDTPQLRREVTPFIIGRDLVALVIDDPAATPCGHDRAIIAMGEFILVGDPGAGGGPYGR